MKLTIDFDNRIINIEEEVKLEDLIDKLKKLFPKDEWKKFKLTTNTFQYWYNPIVEPIQPFWSYPWYQPSEINCGYATDGSGEFSINQCFGTHNLEV